MKIKRVRLQDFRNHSDSTLELDTFNVIKGGNFQGKSSIGQAISMLLTPSTTGLDATGRGFNTKIKRGAQKAILTGVIQGSKRTIERTVTLNTNTTGRTDSSVCLDDPEYHPAPFEKLLDNNRPALAVCLNTERFLLMDEKEQKSLLAKLALPKEYDFPEDVMDAVDTVLGEGTIEFGGEPFAVIDKAYKALYQERQVVNRQVKDFSIPDPVTIANGVDAASLQAKLNEARERQKKISVSRDEAVSKNSEADLKRTKLQGRVESLTEKIEEEQKRITELERWVLSESRGKEIRNVAEGKATFDKLESERQLLLARIAAKKAKVDSYRKLSGVSGECPTCHQDINAETIKELSEQAMVELSRLQQRDTKILLEMKALGDVTGAVKAIVEHDKATTGIEEIRTVIGEKNKLLDDANAEINKLPASTDALLPFVESLDGVEREINHILDLLKPAAAAEERKKEIAIKTEQLKRLEAKASSVDALVKKFDKDGIKAELLAEHIGGFEKRLNSVLSAWGYTCTLSIEPYEFLVTDTNKVTTPVKELSGSEQLMFMVALQCAVSKAAGIGIVIADKLDTFLPSQRRKANEALYNLVKDGVLDQVFAIMSDETATSAPLRNSAFFFVEGGTVRRL